MSRWHYLYCFLLVAVSTGAAASIFVHFNAPRGEVVKKYYYPAHVKTWGQPEDGEGKTEFTPGDNIYYVRPVSKVIPEQYIVQLANGKQSIMLRVPKKTWILNNPGEMFIGDFYDISPVW